jgi:Reverse transcriptase (RNA-dependent DNA polymerase)
MKIPQGLREVEVSDKVLKPNKSIYALVQAARHWHKHFEEEILKLGYFCNEINLCVFLKLEGDAFCLLCFYVDEGIIAGDVKLMGDTLSGLNLVFKIKVQKSIQDFLGCEINESVSGFVLSPLKLLSTSLDQCLSHLMETTESYNELTA